MSDDTPTQRFPEQPGAPTERITTAEVEEDLAEEKQRSKGLLIGLIIAGVLLLVAIIVLVVVLIPKGNGDPVVAASETPQQSESATPTPEPTAGETPTADPEPTPEPTQPPQQPQQPQQPMPTVTSFSVSTPTVFCGKNGQPDNIDLYFSWSTSNGNRVYFGVDTNDASAAALFSNLPTSGDTASNFPNGYSPYQYACGTPTHKYTITVVDNAGHKASKSITITDVNYNN
jgi:hypothetical protein